MTEHLQNRSSPVGCMNIHAQVSASCWWEERSSLGVCFLLFNFHSVDAGSVCAAARVDCALDHCPASG